MDTLRELLRRGGDELRASGSATARLDAELLLSHVLHVERPYLLAHPNDGPSQAAREAFEHLVARRAAAEPVAYLIGRRDWYDLTLGVTPAVLVPRPETEGLLERALLWARDRTVHVAVDVGTGSGALAIALARALPDTRIYATELSVDALSVARHNAGRTGVEGRITFLQGDLLAPLPERVELIVANLPYIGEQEYLDLARDVRLYEPRMALVGGTHGHELLAHMMADAPAYLSAGGAIFAELGPPQAGPALVAASGAFPQATCSLEADYAGLTRYLSVTT